jgi:hypothetical protein
VGESVGVGAGLDDRAVEDAQRECADAEFGGCGIEKGRQARSSSTLATMGVHDAQVGVGSGAEQADPVGAGGQDCPGLGRRGRVGSNDVVLVQCPGREVGLFREREPADSGSVYGIEGSGEPFRVRASHRETC